VNGLKSKVEGRLPIIAERGTNSSPTEDQYFKGALFLNTLRSVVNDDIRWFKLIHDFYQHFKYQNIMTEDVVTFFNTQLKANLTPIFDQYLRHPDIPTLELRFDDSHHSCEYRWKVDEPDFAMPVQVGPPGHRQTIKPTTQWQSIANPQTKSEFEVATDLYYIKVTKV